MSAVLITAIDGNKQRLDGGAMFGNAPRAVWEKWLAPDPQGRIPLNCRAMLLEIDGKRVLCETGIGAFFEPKLAERYGVTETTHKLLENLTLAGLSERDIDFVILSHLHFDHAGGLLPSWTDQQSGRGDLLFPNARYVVGQTSLERAKAPHSRDRASFIPGLAEKLEASGRLIVVNAASHQDALPGTLSFIFTDGHTPGHMHTIATTSTADGANNHTVVFAGDLIPGRSWVHLPITMGYDRFPERVIDEKSAFYDRFAGDNTWVFYTHDHEVAMSHIKRDDKGRFVPYGDVATPKKFQL
jgi:glyoxylase-like metal-dependent hydrolase (beta-lactamase superfamily II)